MSASPGGLHLYRAMRRTLLHSSRAARRSPKVGMVLSQNKVVQRFAERILDKVADWVQQRFEEQDVERPGGLTWVCGAVLRRVAAPGRARGRHSLSCSCDSLRMCL